MKSDRLTTKMTLIASLVSRAREGRRVVFGFFVVSLFVGCFGLVWLPSTPAEKKYCLKKLGSNE